MKVLVTGATGLLGFNTLVQLLKEGYDVMALVRNPKKLSTYFHARLQVVQGDITNSHCVEKAVRFCDYVVHSAADTQMNHLSLHDYKPVNINGTTNIINACKQSGVKKLIYVSSANTLGYGSLNNPGDEQKEIRLPYTKSYYAQSKLKAQEIIKKASKDICIVTVHPSFMIGPYDLKPSSGKIFKMILDKPVVYFPPGGKNFVHVKDVARGIIQAIKIGKNKSNYLLCGENLSFKQFYAAVLKEEKQRSVMVPLSKELLKMFGYAGDIIRSLGLKTEISSVNIHSLLISNFYTNQKAKEELKLEFSPVSDGIRDALDWFRSQKNLQKSIPAP
jgi:nucleoside-diphosphate-sugar epimerase